MGRDVVGAINIRAASDGTFGGGPVFWTSRTNAAAAIAAASRQRLIS